MKNKGKIFIISGISGSGQDSVIEGLMERGMPIERVVTTTTRLARRGETNGKQYYFISVEEFKKKLADNEFVEWAIVFGNYNGCTYKELERIKATGRIGIWRIDIQGVVTVKSKMPEIVAICIKPPSLEVAIERRKKRGLESEEVLGKRIEEMREHFKPENDSKYDFIVVNEEGKLDETVEKVKRIIEES
ncbi:MAG TPA: hypothetical protein P5267_01080 [Patescibacteria group bacterium]|nr:hypothetical protein [Patescibacteria group bacterium]